MSNIKKVFSFKVVSILITVVFLLNNTAYGIDLSSGSNLRVPLIGNNQPVRHRFKEALFDQIKEILGQVVVADRQSDLEFYGEVRRALLLENGSVLLNEELYRKYGSGELAQEREALQVIIHELIETRLQVLKREDISRYNSIKEIAWNYLDELYFATNRSNPSYRDEILANDAWAVIFEHRLMGIKPEDIADENLRTLLIKGYKIIDARPDLFGNEFNSLYRVKEAVLEAVRSRIRLSRVAIKLATGGPEDGSMPDGDELVSMDNAVRPFWTADELDRQIEICKQELGIIDQDLTPGQEGGIISLAKDILRRPSQYKRLIDEAREQLRMQAWESSGEIREPELFDRVKMRSAKRALKNILGVDIFGRVSVASGVGQQDRTFAVYDAWRDKITIPEYALSDFWILFEEGTHCAACLNGGGFDVEWLDEGFVQRFKQHLIEDKNYSVPERENLMELMAHIHYREWITTLEEEIGWEVLALTFFSGNDHFLIEALGPYGVKVYQLLESIGELQSEDFTYSETDPSTLIKFVLNNKYSEENLDIIAELFQWLDVLRATLQEGEDAGRSPWPIDIRKRLSIIHRKCNALRAQLEPIDLLPERRWAYEDISQTSLEMIQEIASSTINPYLARIANDIMLQHNRDSAI